MVYVAVMLFGIFQSPLSFFCLFALVHLGCWDEWLKLAKAAFPDRTPDASVYKVWGMLIGSLLLFFNAVPSLHIGNINFTGIGWFGLLIATVAFCVKEILFKKEISLFPLFTMLAGLAYLSLSCSAIIGLYGSSALLTNNVFTPGWTLPVLVIGTIWINDTMAYIVGSFIGKRPLSPVSPKKTWEGTLGGALIAIGVSMYAAKTFLAIDNRLLSGSVTTLTAMAGTLGDLLESKFKRMAGVKDSGNILPGHGGFLDRFDSMLLAAPAVWGLLKAWTFVFPGL